MTIFNLPDSFRAYVVARACDGDLWFWGSWDDETAARAAAAEIGGIVVSGDLARYA